MKSIKTKSLFLLLICSLTISADIKMNVHRYGRRIQVDGFLLEWSPKEALRWANTPWIVDAINTSEGIAGFFSSDNLPVESEWVFVFTSSSEKKLLGFKIPSDQRSDLFAFDKELYHKSGVINCEWILPWDLIGITPESEYKIKIIAETADLDSASHELLLAGTRDQTVSEIFTPRVIIQAILIVILLVIYIMLRKWVRSRTGQKGSPHRSA